MTDAAEAGPSHAMTFHPDSAPADHLRRVDTLDGPTPTVTQTLAPYRQGDVLATLTRIPVIADDGSIGYHDAPNGSVLLSQTCDIVQASRPSVAIAPLAYLPGAAAGEARSGKRPSYVHVPELGEDAFAHLEVVGTATKGWLAQHARTPGLSSDSDLRMFARAVARKFGRFAFPDEVVAWLQPPERVLGSKAPKAASPERGGAGRCCRAPHRGAEWVAETAVHGHPRRARQARCSSSVR